MPRGLNRSGNFSSGTPITLPHEFGNPVTLPKNFGNVMTHGSDPTQFGNPVTWTPDPAHFGNPISGSTPPPPSNPAPTVVQHKMMFDGGGVTPNSAIVLDAPATPGNSIYVYIQFAAGGTSVSVPTDDALNVYTLVRGPDVFTSFIGQSSCYLYKCAVVAGAPTTITVHGSANANAKFPMGVAVETTPSTVDASQYAAVSYTTTDTDGGALVTSADDLLLLFAIYVNGGGSATFSAGTGWTLVDHLNDTNFLGAAESFSTQHAATPGSQEVFVKLSTNGPPGGMSSIALKG